MRVALWYCVVTVLVIPMIRLTAFSDELLPDYQSDLYETVWAPPSACPLPGYPQKDTPTVQLSLCPTEHGCYKEEKVVEYIVITARGTDSRISQTPGGVGVIDNEAISEAQSVSLTNVARRIPGVEKTSDSAWGSDINIRGLDRNRVLFLIDGCRVNTATDINAQFGFINPSDIEQIELLKGPVSALYGSGSMGGVVNVITKKGHFTERPQWHGESSLIYTGNPQGVGTYGNISFNSLDYWIFSSGSYRDHQSYDAGSGDKISNSQFRDSHTKAGMGVKLNSMNVTEVEGQYFEAGNVGIPGKGLSLPSGADVTYPTTTLSLINLTHTFTPEDLLLAESRVNLFYQKIERQVRIDHFLENSSLTENCSGADHETLGVKWQNLFDLKGHTLVAGADLWSWAIGDSERYKSFKNGLTGVDSSLGDLEQFSGGAFAEDGWQIGQEFTLNVGGRIDYICAKSSDLYNWIRPPSQSIPALLMREGDRYHDVSWNGHLGVTWNFIPRWSTTFILASSYRAPDLMDRFKYISLGSGVELFGNPYLDPERSIFFEYGLHYNDLNFSFTASTYANYLEDLITEQVVSQMVHSMENVDKARIYGAEFELKWFFAPQWAIYTNMALTDGEDTTIDQELPFIPPLNGLTALRYDHNTGFWSSLEIEWSARQSDVPSGGMESGSWGTMKFRAGYRFISGKIRHEIMIGVDNMFDRDYRNYLSTSRDIELKEPGTSCLASWKMQF